MLRPVCVLRDGPLRLGAAALRGASQTFVTLCTTATCWTVGEGQRSAASCCDQEGQPHLRVNAVPPHDCHPETARKTRHHHPLRLALLQLACVAARDPATPPNEPRDGSSRGRGRAGARQHAVVLLEAVHLVQQLEQAALALARAGVAAAAPSLLADRVDLVCAARRRASRAALGGALLRQHHPRSAGLLSAPSTALASTAAEPA